MKVVLLAQSVDVYEFINEYKIDAAATANIAATVFEAELSEQQLDQLYSDPRVLAIEDPQTPIVDAVVDAGANWAQARLSDAWANSRTSLYQYSRDGAGVTIYSIDGGVDLEHIQFANAFIRRAEGSVAPIELNDHATKIAGVIVGRDYGLARRVTLVDCENGPGTTGLAATCDWIIQDHQAHGGPSVITSSTRWTTQSSVVDTAASNCIAAGIQWFNSAGNDNTDTSAQSPINLVDVMVVGGLDPYSKKAAGSSYGPHVNIWAPYRFWRMPDLTSAPYKGDSTSWGETNEEGRMVISSGTSYSTPATAAVAALILQEQPTLTPAQLRDVLVNQWAISNAITGIPAGGGANYMTNLGPAKNAGTVHSWPSSTAEFKTFGSGRIPSRSGVWSSSGSVKQSGSGGSI